MHISTALLVASFYFILDLMSESVALICFNCSNHVGAEMNCERDNCAIRGAENYLHPNDPPPIVVPVCYKFLMKQRSFGRTLVHVKKGCLLMNTDEAPKIGDSKCIGAELLGETGTASCWCRSNYCNSASTFRTRTLLDDQDAFFAFLSRLLLIVLPNFVQYAYIYY